MQVEFVGQSARDIDSPQAATSRLLNCYREPSQGRTPFIVKSVLGMVQSGTITGVYARAAAYVQGASYVAFAGSLWRLSGATATNLGAIADSYDTSISRNNKALTVVAGGRYFVRQGGSITEPTAGAFGSFGSVTFMAQRTVLTERGGRRIQWSAVADADSLDGLDFATAEQRDDDIIRALPIGAELWVFKQSCIERWYTTDTGFAYIPGSLLEIGLKSFALLSPIQSGAFLVGTDGKVYLAAGGLKPVSTPAVESSIASETPLNAFYYQDHGHEFCCLTFAGRPAWCYDVTMGEWHERGQGDGPWLVTHAWFDDTRWNWVTNSGTFGYLSGRETDLGGTLLRKMVSRTLQQEGRRFRVPSLRFQANVGRDNPDRTLDEEADVLRVSGTTVLRVDGSDVLLVEDTTGITTPQMMLRVSGDHGQTWGQPRQKSLGDIGAYETQLVFRALGQFRALTVEVSCTDPIETVFDATAFLEVA